MPAYSKQWAREQSIHALATHAMFDRRARDFKKKLRFLDWWGLSIPIATGGLVLASIPLGSGLISFAGVFSVCQALVFLWALTQRWPDQLEGAAEARRANRESAELYHDYVMNEPSVAEWNRVEAKREAQTAQDEKAELTGEELRYGMRFALRQYQFPCATCKNVPASMAPTTCGTCGNFNSEWVK